MSLLCTCLFTYLWDYYDTLIKHQAFAVYSWRDLTLIFISYCQSAALYWKVIRLSSRTLPSLHWLHINSRTQICYRTLLDRLSWQSSETKHFKGISWKKIKLILFGVFLLVISASNKLFLLNMAKTMTKYFSSPVYCWY